MSLIEKLAAEGLLGLKERERVERNVEEFMKAAEDYPELMEEALTKVAGISDLWAKAKPGLGHMALSTGGAIALAGLGTIGNDMYRGIKGSILKAKGYKTMMEENPDLAKLPAKQTQAIFNTLNTLNPTYASDPLVSGSFVRNTVDMERLDVGSLKNISEGYRAQQSQGGSSFGDILRTTTGAMEGAQGAEAAALSQQASMARDRQTLEEDKARSQHAEQMNLFWGK